MSETHVGLSMVKQNADGRDRFDFLAARELF